MGEGFFRYSHVTSTGVSAISINEGAILHGIVLNQVSTAAASTSLCSVYDSTTTSATAKLIAIIDTTRTGISDYIYDVVCKEGITLNIGGSAAPVDISVAFR